MKKSEVERHARRDAAVAETARLAEESQPKTSEHTLETVTKERDTFDQDNERLRDMVKTLQMERDEARDACYRVTKDYEALQVDVVTLRAEVARLTNQPDQP